MKRIIVPAILATVIATALSLGTTPRANASSGCSSEGAAGQWGYTYTGTIYLPSGAAPLASTGTFVQDATGRIVGRQTRSVAGAAAEEVIKGRFNVKSDCTVTGAVRVYQGGKYERTGYLDGVYVDGMKHVRFIFEALILADKTNVPVVITIDGNHM